MDDTLQVMHDGKRLSVAIKRSQISDTWIVFVHGIGCAKECFDRAFEEDFAKRYSLLALDLIGFGSSDKPADFSYSMEDQAAVVQSVIQQYQPAEVVLVGHSMGGTIGTILASTLDKLVAFVNVEGNLVSQDAGIVSRHTAEQEESEFIRHGFDDFLLTLKASESSSFRLWGDWYTKSDKLAVYKSAQSLVSWSDRNRLLGIFNQLIEKAYIYGQESDKSAAIGQLTNTDVISVPNAGHFVMLDNPVYFYSWLNDYLSNKLS